jgi:hypothetical protein
MRLVFVRPWLSAGAVALALTLVGCGDRPAPEVEEHGAASAETSAGSNTPPDIASVRFEPAEVAAGEAVRVIVEASDPDGDPVKLVYDWKLDGSPVGRGTPRLLLRDASKGELYDVTVIASDGRADSEPRVLSARVANRPPRVDRLRIEPTTPLTAGMRIVVQPEGQDDDGDPVQFSYAWMINGAPTLHDGPELDTATLRPGDEVVVAVRASDGEDDSEMLTSQPLSVSNRPPSVTSRPGSSLPGGAFHYLVEAVDPDGDAPLRFELDESPAGMQIGAISGEVDWRPTASQAGRHTVRVIVDDLRGGRIAHAFEVEVAGSGGPPAAPEN